MKIAIYARISPTQKVKGKELAYAIENQIDRCRKQAKADNAIIYNEYYDEYISGKAQEYMKAFIQMIKDAKEKKFEKIYCLRVDRFGRNLQQMINTQKELQNLNISIKFIEQGFDTSNTFGRMTMGIMASIAEWQRESIVENIKEGRDRAYAEHPEKFGRPKIPIDWKRVNNFLAVKDVKTNKYSYSWSEISRILKISTATLLSRYRKEIGEVKVRRI